MRMKGLRQMLQKQSERSWLTTLNDDAVKIVFSMTEIQVSAYCSQTYSICSIMRLVTTLASSTLFKSCANPANSNPGIGSEALFFLSGLPRWSHALRSSTGRLP